MCHLRHSLILSMLWVLNGIAQADALSDAQAHKAQAMNEFYTSYRHSSDHSPEAVARLKQKTVGAAAQHASKVLIDESMAAVQSMGVEVVTPGQQVQSKRAPASYHEGKSSSSAQKARAAEPVLDGTKIPPRISFEKK